MLHAPHPPSSPDDITWLSCPTGGRGGGWNVRNRRHLAMAISAGVTFGALGMHIPVVPVHVALQGPFGRLGGAAAICLHEALVRHILLKGVACLFLCHNLRNLSQFVQWYFRIGTQFSPHQVSFVHGPPSPITRVAHFAVPRLSPGPDGQQEGIAVVGARVAVGL